MLPIPTLDDEGFREITENARSMIPMLYPDWTDFNYHDPGITFLELFAFLKESQQYHLDQIGPAQRRKYLKLLGMTRLRRAPARVSAIVSASGGTLPRGARLAADGVPFETERAVSFDGGRLRGGFVFDGGRRTEFDAGAYAEAGKLQMEVFGRRPAPGAAWYLRFDGPLPGPVSLWLWVRQDWPVRRNPIGGGPFVPLAQLQWESLEETGWETAEVESDATHGFLFSGEVTLRPRGAGCPAAQAPAVAREALPSGERDGYWLRVRMVGGSYDVPPVLTGLSDRMVPTVQWETLASCTELPLSADTAEDGALLSGTGDFEAFVPADGGWRRTERVRRVWDGMRGCARFTLEGETAQRLLLLAWRAEFAAQRHLPAGSGFPGQTVELEQKGQIYESFTLLVAEADRPDVWQLWEKVEDFDASGPDSRHYVLDEETGTVRFGDCIHGLAPEGEILIAAQAVTLGDGGNVKAGRLRQAETAFPGDGSLTITNPDNAAGGRSRESDEACFARCRSLLRRTERAVTDQDYEQLVRRTPGLMISNCKAVPPNRIPQQDGSLKENCVTVVVEPYSLTRVGALSPAYSRNILRYLDERRMLGTQIALLAPEYIGVVVYAEILSQPHYVDAQTRIQNAVTAFFARGWEFGEPVQYSALYGIIDTLDCVAGIETMTIDAQGKGISRSVSGDVLLPYNGLAVLKSAAFQVRPAE